MSSVDRRGRLVEHEHVGIDERRTHERHQLPLAGGQLRATLADVGVEAIRQRVEPVAEIEPVERAADLVERQARTGEAEVRGDRPVEQERLLRDDDEPRAEVVVRDGGQRHPSDSHDAGGRVGEARHQAPKRGLARARLADHRDLLAGGDVDAHVDEHGCVVVVRARRVGERDVIDVDRQRSRGQPVRVGRLRRSDGDLEDPDHAAQTCHGGLGLLDHLGELCDRLEEPVRQEHEAHERAGGEAARRRRAPDRWSPRRRP